MDELNSLDQFDLGKHGDRHERDFWPLLCKRFPSYEVLWRQLIVPMTFRISQEATLEEPNKWIRFRPGIPVNYEKMAMAHYSVFYFLGRAMKRTAEEAMAFEHPEDVFFLLDCVSDNFKSFMGAMNTIGADNGIDIFDQVRIAQFPRGSGPFKEISAYRDVLLHNPVIGRAMDLEKAYLPKWQTDSAKSPLDRAKRSWSEAEKLSPADLVSTKDLLERLVIETCVFLEEQWRDVLKKIDRPSFKKKLVGILGLEGYFPLPTFGATPAGPPGASGNYAVR